MGFSMRDLAKLLENYLKKRKDGRSSFLFIKNGVAIYNILVFLLIPVESTSIDLACRFLNKSDAWPTGPK